MAEDLPIDLARFEAPDFEAPETAPDRTGRLEALEIGTAISLTLLTQTGLAFLVATGRTDLSAAVAIHTAVTVGLGAWAFLPRRKDPRLHGTLAFASGLGFIFGTVGTLIAFGLRELGIRARLGGAGWYALLFPTSSVTRRDRLERDARHRNRRARLDLPEEVAPLADVLARGRTEDRIRVVAFLGRNFRPRYADALRQALADPDPAIRAQAAGVAAGVERRLADGLHERQRAFEKAPVDADRISALADFYDEFAYTGLVSAPVAQGYRDEAVKLYRRLLDRDPSDDATRMLLVRLYLRMQKPGEALRLIGDMPDEVDDLTAWFSWLAETYYRTRRYAELRALCTRADREISVRDVPIAVRQAIQLWSEADDAKTA